MPSEHRSSLQPAFLLHQRPFRDSSRIIDVFSREHGRLSLVARGSRGGKSRLKGILRPFQPLRLSWTLKRDLGTLTGAEAAGPATALVGESLLSAYYLNELLLNFLHRHDPQSEIFDLYGTTLAALLPSSLPARELRGFEIELLRLLGYALDLDADADTGELVDDTAWYQYRTDRGLVRVSGSERQGAIAGTTLRAIAARDFDDGETLRAAGRLLRPVIDYHLNGKPLNSRKVLIELRRDRMSNSVA